MSSNDSATNSPPVTIVGSYLSPYVRKVLVCLETKGIAYRIDPIVPYYGNEAFERVSPLRRIPVLIDDRIALADSTIICEYLDERYPNPPLLPRETELRARSRWLEEYADSRMGEVFIWHFYNQLVIRKFVWGLPPEEPVLKAAIESEIPQVLSYLEAEVPQTGLLFGSLSIADIAIASFFRNAGFAHFAIDAKRWPRTAQYIARVLSHRGFEKIAGYEDLLLRTPIPQHRAALMAAGAPVSAETFGTSEPRPGVLSV